MKTMAHKSNRPLTLLNPTRRIGLVDSGIRRRGGSHSSNGCRSEHAGEHLWTREQRLNRETRKGTEHEPTDGGGHRLQNGYRINQ